MNATPNFVLTRSAHPEESRHTGKTSATQWRPSDADRGRFERLLRQKSREDEAGDSAPESAEALFASMAPIAVRHGGTVDADGETLEGLGGGTRATLEAVPEAIPDAAAEAAAARFEVSLGERAGVCIELCATRETDPNARPSWSLSISAPAADAAALSRNLGRLNDRLQARTIAHSHIRIEERPDSDDDHGRR